MQLLSQRVLPTLVRVLLIRCTPLSPQAWCLSMEPSATHRVCQELPGPSTDKHTCHESNSYSKCKALVRLIGKEKTCHFKESKKAGKILYKCQYNNDTQAPDPPGSRGCSGGSLDLHKPGLRRL